MREDPQMVETASTKGYTITLRHVSFQLGETSGKMVTKMRWSSRNLLSQQDFLLTSLFVLRVPGWSYGSFNPADAFIMENRGRRHGAAGALILYFP